MDNQAYSHWLFLYNLKRIVNIAFSFSISGEAKAFFFKVIILKVGGTQQKSQIFLLLQTAVSEQAWRAVRWTIRLALCSCCSRAFATFLPVLQARIPQYLPTTPSLQHAKFAVDKRKTRTALSLFCPIQRGWRIPPGLLSSKTWGFGGSHRGHASNQAMICVTLWTQEGRWP